MRSKQQPAATSQLILALGLFFALVGLVGYALWIAGGALVRDGNWVGVDFQVYYQAARALGRGENIYTAGISPPYVYPPLLALLVNPLSLLPIAPATILWKAIQHLCLLVAGALLTRLSPAGVRPLVFGTLFLSLLLVPLREEIRVGESNSLILALVVGALFFASRTTVGSHQPTATKSVLSPHSSALTGGLLLAFAVSIKVLPVLVLAYFWWRGPRSLAAWATGGFLGLQLLTLLIAPANTLHYWLVEFPGLFGQAFPYLDNQSLNAFFSRALLPSDPAYPNLQLMSGESLRPLLAWAANLLAAGAAIWALWRVRTRDPQPDPATRNTRLLLEVGLVLLTTHLVSGSTWLHHLVALSVPVAGLLGAWWLRRGVGRRGSGVSVELLVGGLFLSGVVLARKPEEWVALADGIAPGSAPLALLASSLPMLVVIGLWVATWRAMQRLPRGQTTGDAK